VRTFDPAGGTVDLDPMVAAALAYHVRQYPPVDVEVLDITSGRQIRRSVPLLFTTVHGNPFTDRTWSGEWVKWRKERVGQTTPNTAASTRCGTSSPQR